MGTNINKALLPFQNRAIISHIIEKFPGSEFVIALGFLGHQVREYIEAAHPELKVEYIEVKKTEGPGSGPGQSILECEPKLQEPFYFVACDTLWTDPLPTNSNQSWIGIDSVPDQESTNYCNIICENGWVLQNADKVFSPHSQAFIGLGFFHPEPFFAALKKAKVINRELQISDGLLGLIPFGLEGKKLSWQDFGTAEKYRKIATTQNYDFSKTDEYIYFTQSRVIKFFSDPNICANRVKRAQLNPGTFPAIAYAGKHFYAYPFTTISGPPSLAREKFVEAPSPSCVARKNSG